VRAAFGLPAVGCGRRDTRLARDSFRPLATKHGNQPLHIWLATLLDPPIDLSFHEATVEGKRAVLLEVQPAYNKPVSFRGVEYVRVGNSKTQLRCHPEKERALWALGNAEPFELRLAMTGVDGSNCVACWTGRSTSVCLGSRNRGAPTPSSTVCRANAFAVCRRSDVYDVTNLGAILFARDLSQFPRLSRKALRVILYSGANRVQTVEEALVAPAMQ